MNSWTVRAFGLLLLVGSCWADCYLHNPRGSNNRLNERSANRRNGNRVFDSQNNNRGGYNVGDQTDKAFSNEDGQYNMKFFQSGSVGASTLEIEWTNQHGCGGNEDSDPHKLNCNMVLQYMCQDHDANMKAANFPDGYMRNGRQTNTQNYNSRSKKTESKSDSDSRRNNAVSKERVIHESWEWYDSCYERERNKGLFTADQRLRTNRNGYSSAQYTRQNPNGNRRGYECPEERDYYPYWHPTPWVDIAVLTDNTTHCKRYVEESYNRQPRHECYENFTSGEVRHYSRWNNKAECEVNGGVWGWKRNYLEIVDKTSAECINSNASANGTLRWGWVSSINRTNVCYVLPPPVDCQPGAWSRVNHLGNGRDGVPLNYTWRLPYFPSMKDKRCVFRIRYNISTDDYDPLLTNASSNKNIALGRRSPVEQNPNVNIGSKTNHPLRLAINTAQFGRTFQDRSHVMILRSRDAHLKSKQSDYDSVSIRNLNVRGKRGNIVQTFPSVEYDFIPNRLEICPDELIHIQWTGSNTHNNGNPAGDGQAGDAGEGTGGTDRHNMVQTNESNINFPLPYEHTTLWNDLRLYWASFAKTNTTALSAKDISIAMASSGYYECHSTCTKKAMNPTMMLNNLLNNAPASFEGAVFRFTQSDQDKTYQYICTRNNNFTNRSQKGWIKVLKRSHPKCQRADS